MLENRQFFLTYVKFHKKWVLRSLHDPQILNPCIHCLYIMGWFTDTPYNISYAPFITVSIYEFGSWQ